MLAEAARYNVDHGAQLIDINMGCPAKKVCNVLCGSALLTDEPLFARILAAVVSAVRVPVTLKTRTGWDHENRNAIKIARIAEASGIAAIAIHGRTRADFYSGEAEYATIRNIKESVRIPVIANGDIDSANKARAVLNFTRADGVMIGRAAHGAPWIFRDVNGQLASSKTITALSRAVRRDTILEHLDSLYAFYGEDTGVRVARKHLGWYLTKLQHETGLRRELMAAENSSLQFGLMKRGLDAWADCAVAA